MMGANRSDTFHVAVIAFEIRFEQELSSRWEKREGDTHSAIIGAPLMERSSLFQQFFNDVEAEVAGVIHEYFPSLLKIATTNQEQLGNQSPLTWTEGQVLTQLCNYLRLDETFDET